MKTERRNLYRLLHVQPEAPAEVITAVYRCMMSKLKMHPDLGGNHEVAARINDAYAVLSDPAKRKAYDASRKHKPHARASAHAEPQAQAQRSAAAGSAGFTTAADASAPPPRREFSGRHCPLCNHALPKFIANDTHCVQCGAPLSPIAHHLHTQREALGRRTSNRITRTDTASIQLAAHHSFQPARLRDLSLTGLGLLTAQRIAVDAVVRIMTADMDVVAHVVKVRPVNSLYHLHARLLTGNFNRNKGRFVSASA